MRQLSPLDRLGASCYSAACYSARTLFSPSHDPAPTEEVQTTLIYLGLGANLGDREANIWRALHELHMRGVALRAVSPLYETEPWGLLDQPMFLNAACAAETAFEPLALLDVLKAIERALGRTPTVRNGPRPIDLDILLYGDLVLDSPLLTVPHPGMLQRASVLVPLNDIAPDVRHPLTGETVAQALARLGPCRGVTQYKGVVTPRQRL